MKFTKPSKKFYVMLLINIVAVILAVIPLYYAISLTQAYFLLGLHLDTINNFSTNEFIWVTTTTFVIVYLLVQHAKFWWNLWPLDDLIQSIPHKVNPFTAQVKP